MRVFTIPDLAIASGKTDNSMRRRAIRAHRRRAGLMQVEGIGQVICRKPGRDWEFVLIDEPTVSDDHGTLTELRKILQEQKKYVCNNCAANVIEPMLESMKNEV